MGHGSGASCDPAITNRGGRKLSPFHRKGNTMLRTIEILAYTATWFYIGAISALSFF
jgi:hypothetical protein